MVRVIKHLEGRYETQDVEFGKVYRWCPECVVIECDCGARQTLTASMTSCGECGADHAVVVREELAARRPEEITCPWRYRDSPEDTGMPF